MFDVETYLKSRTNRMKTIQELYGNKEKSIADGKIIAEKVDELADVGTMLEHTNYVSSLTFEDLYKMHIYLESIRGECLE